MKSFIICLSKIESSWETAQRVKQQLAEFGHDAEYFEGSYGSEVKKLFEEQGRVCHPWTFKGPGVRLSDESKAKVSQPGVMGCFYSHYRLWQKCVELNEPIMIFEDDVTFTRPYIPVEWRDILITVFGNATKSAKYYHYLNEPVGDPRAEYYGQASMPGTPGYAIKPHAAKKLVDMYQNTFLPSDNAMNKHVVEIQVHSHVMGRALDSEDNKKSLVRTKGEFWETWKND